MSSLYFNLETLSYLKVADTVLAYKSGEILFDINSIFNTKYVQNLTSSETWTKIEDSREVGTHFTVYNEFVYRIASVPFSSFNAENAWFYLLLFIKEADVLKYKE